MSDPGKGPGAVREGTATLDEARSALDGLTDADYTKLMIIAKCFARARLRGTVVEPQDLLQEAVVKTLAGQRRWNKRVSIIRHLDRVMESDAGHFAEKRALVSMEEMTDVPHAGLRDSDDEGPDAQEKLECVRELFEGDTATLRLLSLKGEGESPAAIRTAMGLSKTQYETILKRIRRRLVRHSAEGGREPCN